MTKRRPCDEKGYKEQYQTVCNRGLHLCSFYLPALLDGGDGSENADGDFRDSHAALAEEPVSGCV